MYTGTALTGEQPPGAPDFFGDHVAADSRWLMVGAARESIDFDGDGLDPAQGDVQVGALYLLRDPVRPIQLSSVYI